MKITQLITTIMSVGLFLFTVYFYNIINFRNEKLHYEIKQTKQLVIDESNVRELELLNIKKEKQKLSEKLSIFETAFQSEDKRWAKIKKIRKVIRQTIKNKKYPNLLDITDITALSSSVVDYSEKYDVPISLILAIIERESAFNPNAESSMKAQGLMQLIPTTAIECAGDLGVRHYNIFNIDTNIHFGVWYLRKVLDIFKDRTELAIKAYNCGPTCVQRVEFKDYVKYPEETNLYYGYISDNIESYKMSGL
jgi:membrane-bound lytic murein transglycosylase MltF